ncbi:methyltransferase domain-containing protein [Paenibacillus profundus]|uniref:Methyltransferase domain-containing protein n=1 Tax=Paenibacillus profundus TaxID=1173085 RepID=A0ABS8YCP7_9BACL|nr:methyltransferase domain-containing protein [Paenibacillus profundus]MCE5169381.1 methyltransferase domain-containing protein [Paenibacillus profundus]
MKLLDEVTEAYHGSKGEVFARKTREGIHWICSQAKGQDVLDIGCSQGITEIILAREGKKAVGIDIEPEAIEYAKASLSNQSESVQANVTYEASSIFDYNSEHQFDTVILSEVLEHFSSSESLLERISGFLKQDGTLIITVPFGINDYIDHKKTYYLFNLLDDLAPYFSVFEVKFFGKWIGVVAEKCPRKRPSVDNDIMVRELEKQFYAIERSLVDNLSEKSNKLVKLNTQYREVMSTLEELKRENTALKKQIETLEIKSTELPKDHKDNDIASLNQKIEELTLSLSKSKGIIMEKNQTIMRRIKSEEETLSKYKDSIFQYNQLEARYANVSKKYDLLSKAKLGKLTLNYWKYKKRIPNDF